MKLTVTEKNAFIALQMREQETARDHQAIVAEVEGRLRLPSGSLGNTHQVNLQTMEVIETPQSMAKRIQAAEANTTQGS